MTNTRLATRYAKSLLDLAIEMKQLDPVYKDMVWLQELCRVSRDFTHLLKSPVINADTKIRVINEVTKKKVSEMTDGFIRLLVKKGREAVLPEILTAFIRQYRAHKQIHVVKLTTAVTASEELKKAVVKKLRSSTSMQEIELETIVDEDIIGGFLLQTGDQLVDASVAYDLKIVARQFENNDFIYKVR